MAQLELLKENKVMAHFESLILPRSFHSAKRREVATSTRDKAHDSAFEQRD